MLHMHFNKFIILGQFSQKYKFWHGNCIFPHGMIFFFFFFFFLSPYKKGHFLEPSPNDPHF